jgi:hypothetical protein
MKICLAAVALALAAAAVPAQAAGVKLGVLSCDIQGATSYVIGSDKPVECVFRSTHGRYRYTGIVSKLGVDLGFTDQGTLQWAVLGVGSDYDEEALAGNYYGVNAEASVAVGGGGNVLVGGFRNSFVLQPLSAQAQTGLNLAVTVASLELITATK